jgi:sulfatase maturation enzyme AslB (radical SAM superfamily)
LERQGRTHCGFGVAHVLVNGAPGGRALQGHLLCNYSRKTFNAMPEREKTLTINEIYHSIQGESTWVGQPCVFVRLTFCDLRCNYCDTEYAFYEGKKQTLKEIVDAVAAYRCPLVEITGGEPLLQKNVLPLMSRRC